MELLAVARKTRQNAHAPYSSFLVGAALLALDGTLTPGCNVEVAADSGTCAEGVAVANAITQGALARGQKFIRAVAITTEITAEDSDKGLANSSPCGICRQVLHDFADEKTCSVILDDRQDGIEYPLAKFLPYGFRMLRPEAKIVLADCTALEAAARTDPSPENLARIAKAISANAAAHTRGQPEGAVIITRDGKAFCGVSVENSNANHYTRALAVAANRAVLSGQRGKFVAQYAVYSSNQQLTPPNPALLEEFFIRP